MNPRCFSVLVLLALGVGVRAAQPPPNILFIMADDHGRQATSCYGGNLIQTPNIDRLAASGIRFTHAMAGNSICSPSRAMLLTGKYNHLCGVRQLGGQFDGAQETFPKLLQKAGYATALIGKWHLGSRPTGFDHFEVVPTGAHVDPRMTDETMPWKGDAGGPLRKGYSTDLLTDDSLQWMGRQKDKPFCLMLHFTAPHSPHIPAPQDRRLFEGAIFPAPGNLLDNYRGRAPEKVADQLAWSRLTQQCEPQYQPVRKQCTGDREHDTKLMYQTYARNYLRMVASLDRNVGRLLDYLDQSGLATNTVVIYTSDNGYFLGEHGFYNKMWMYEEGFIIPMLVRLPGVRNGLVSDRLVSILDVAPTILDLAAVEIPADLQGKSMRPLLDRGSAPWRESFYYHYYGGPKDDRGHDNAGVNWIWSPGGEIIGVRTATTKLICYPRWKGGPFWEYFDLAQDPHEMSNLYDAPDRQKEVADMKDRLLELAGDNKDTAVVGLLGDEGSKKEDS